ncbi:MAG: bifunctional precorrin-2 dehydrogenase/sirohydrochlorin ferrochelatase [Bacteroidota bacterium]|nr:MAG: bifunctional precorrin-2 dehydrogenase/sirohydrochlorin ferrochelatase [Bacteroidota bacterium]
MKYAEKEMNFLPISLNISHKLIVIVGGGRVAYHKIKLLLPFTNHIKVIAREVCQELRDLHIPFIEKDYIDSDLEDAFLVYACTNIKNLNEQVYHDAHKLGILVNVVDNPPLCDFVSPAIYKKDHMTVAVGSNARDVYASIRWRDRIRNYLESNPEE